MINLLLVGGIISFVLSFFIHKYFVQFIVLSVFLIVLYIIIKNSRDIGGLKKTIQEHNELLRKDLE